MKEKQLKDGDYVLTDGRAWFRIDNLAICIQKTDEGVVVDLYPHSEEACDPIASTYAYFAEAEEWLESAKESERKWAGT
jgi:hypothetical protein